MCFDPRQQDSCNLFLDGGCLLIALDTQRERKFMLPPSCQREGQLASHAAAIGIYINNETNWCVKDCYV